MNTLHNNKLAGGTAYDTVTGQKVRIVSGSTMAGGVRIDNGFGTSTVSLASLSDITAPNDLPGKAVPDTDGNARIERTTGDRGETVYVLYVRFLNGKLRDVGYYRTRVEAMEALRNGTYGF